MSIDWTTQLSTPLCVGMGVYDTCSVLHIYIWEAREREREMEVIAPTY
jgi:hypothetical protein